MKITPLKYHDLQGRKVRALEAEPVDVAALRSIDAEVSPVCDYLDSLIAQRAACILVPDLNVRRTREQLEASDRAADDVAVIEHGTWGQGYWDPLLKESVDSVGSNVLKRLRDECRELIEREQHRPTMTWPARFRYVGKPGVAELNGDLLRPGDVVELSEGQAEAWNDRFVLVTDEQAISS